MGATMKKKTYDAEFILFKGLSVIQSCKTPAQIETASNYCRLLANKADNRYCMFRLYLYFHKALKRRLDYLLKSHLDIKTILRSQDENEN